MFLLASIFLAARALASWSIKSGPAFHQTLIGLVLAFTSHRMLATDCSFLHPEQCLALATDPGPSRPAKLWLSDLTSYYQDWLPTPTHNIGRQGLERLSTHTNTLFLDPSKCSPLPGRSKMPPGRLQSQVSICIHVSSPFSCWAFLPCPLGWIPANVPCFNLT